MGALRILSTLSCVLHLFASASAQYNGTVGPAYGSYGIVMFPGFDWLDLASPVEILNYVGFKFKMNVALISETMDPVITGLTKMNPLNSTVRQMTLPTHPFSISEGHLFLKYPSSPQNRQAFLSKRYYLSSLEI